MNYKSIQDCLLKFLVAASPIFYNPFADLPFRSLRETLFQIAVMGVVLCWCGRLIFYRRYPEGGFWPGGISTRALAGLFILSAAAYWISLVVNGADVLAVKTVVNYLLGGVLFFAFLDSFSRDGIGGWVKILAVVIFVNGVYAIAQFSGWDPLFQPRGSGPLYRPHLAAGFMDSPNMLAPLLVSLAPYFFARWMASGAGREFYLSGAALLFLLVPIALTRNVAGWVSLLIVLLALILFFSWYEYRKRTGLQYRVVFSWLCVALLAGGGAANYIKAGEATKSMKLRSIKERIMLNRAAWMMFKESPVIGKGPNYFYRHFVQYRRAVLFSNPQKSIHERAAHQTHNDYLQLLAEGGILAALPVAAILLLFLGEQLKFLRRAAVGQNLAPRDLMTIGAAGGFWSIVINSVGNFPFHVAPLVVAALFWAALSHRLIRDAAGDQPLP